MKVAWFYKPRMEGGMMMTIQGPIKTFPLRGIKESPPYLHDGRLLTLEDVVEFFNLIQQLNLPLKHALRLLNQPLRHRYTPEVELSVLITP
jgi:hypothetical protein